MINPTQKKVSFLKAFESLWHLLSIRRKFQFFLLLILMVLASFAEIMSIGSVIPFLGALTDPEKVFNNDFIQPFLTYFDFNNPEEIIVPFTLIFCFLAILSGVIRLLLLLFSNRFSFATGADLSLRIYERSLYQPYKVHINRSSSEVINGISRKSNEIIFAVILPLTTLLSSGVLLIVILSTLIYVDPFVCILSSLSFGSIYFFIAKLTKNKKISNSFIISKNSTKIIKSLQEGLGSIRDVLISGSQGVYIKNYRQADLPMRKAQSSNQFVGQSPRFIMESVGMVFIAFLALYLFIEKDGLTTAIPALGVLALGAQRLLPLMQQFYLSWSSIQGSYYSLTDVIDLLKQPLSSNYKNLIKTKIKFNKKIVFKNINFNYSLGDPSVLNNINLTINKGEKVGIIGATGSGKSTLIDILMGLLAPTEGNLFIDDVEINPKNIRAWQNRIAHVPQSIFLIDATIYENIALGVERQNIDLDRIKACAIKAQLDDVINNLPQGYDTIIGEGGVRLSGGQRQRVAIARALYKNADVLILDEATSALDTKTEYSVMQSIEALGNKITVIMIAHRITTLKNCSKIIHLSNGEISAFGTYKEITNKK